MAEFMADNIMEICIIFAKRTNYNVPSTFPKTTNSVMRMRVLYDNRVRIRTNVPQVIWQSHLYIIIDRGTVHCH